MRQPDCLAPLVDQGIIQEIVRPLMSGKEAQIYLVVSGDELRVAKVYKEAQNRSFRQRAEYTEGRGVRSSRTQRAVSRRSRFGREQDDAGWRSTEADIIYRLRAAGVRVPVPHLFSDGVLVMELITDANGEPAPRLADVTLGPSEARAVFTTLLSSVVKMLCAGVVHGDLSEFNVLLGQDGPVVIDFPQAVDPAHNQNARKLLIRDVDNLSLFLGRATPGQRRLPYGQELWELYARNELSPETQLTGRYEPPHRQVDESAVLYEIDAAAREAERQGSGPGQGSSRRRRKRKAAPPAAQTSAGTAAQTPVGTAAQTQARAAAQTQAGTAAQTQARAAAQTQAGTAAQTQARAAAQTQARAAAPGSPASPGRPGRNGTPPNDRRNANPSNPPRNARPPYGAKPSQDVRPSQDAPSTGASQAGAGPGGQPAPGTNPAPVGAARRRRRRRRRAANAAPRNS